MGRITAVVAKISGQPAGQAELLVEGKLYRSDHPLVKRFPHLFQDVNEFLKIPAEKATKTPGKKRAPSAKPEGGDVEVR